MGQQRHAGRGFCYNEDTEKEPRKMSGTHVLSELHCVPQKTSSAQLELKFSAEVLMQILIILDSKWRGQKATM